MSWYTARVYKSYFRSVSPASVLAKGHAFWKCQDRLPSLLSWIFNRLRFYLGQRPTNFLAHQHLERSWHIVSAQQIQTELNSLEAQGFSSSSIWIFVRIFYVVTYDYLIDVALEMMELCLFNEILFTGRHSSQPICVRYCGEISWVKRCSRDTWDSSRPIS